MLWIISGPSSAGKSTFLQSDRGAELTGLPAATPVIWPRTQSQLDEVGSGDAFYHYNLLRPQFLDHRLARQARRQGQPAPVPVSGFSDDPPWQGLLKRALPKRAVVLVTSKPTLLQRMAERTDVEDPDFSGREQKQYQTQLWRDLIEQADLPALYQEWCRALDAAGIPYLLVSGEDSSYPVITEAEAAAIAGREREHPEPDAAAAGAGAGPIPNGPRTPYTKERIVAILRERRFGYHRVDLPYGLSTRGEDRSSTRDLVLPASLAGKSVLDVGCALGYFCFEAEARGASRVVGADLRQSRLEDAQLLKEIKGSRVELILRDVVGQPLTERFDYILLLNVIHYLTEPFRAMRQLASITKERLIIEFPTLADPKFAASLDTALPATCDDLPLVGVSSMRKGVDQTFVFSPPAIRRVLLDHERLFETVEIVPSPMPGRAIAICQKAAGAA